MRRSDGGDEGPPLGGSLALALGVGRWRRAMGARLPSIFGVLPKPPERVIHAPRNRGVRADLGVVSAVHTWSELPTQAPDSPSPGVVSPTASVAEPPPLSELPSVSVGAPRSAGATLASPPVRGHDAPGPSAAPSSPAALASLAPTAPVEPSSPGRPTGESPPRSGVDGARGGVQPLIAASPEPPVLAAPAAPSARGRPREDSPSTTPGRDDASARDATRSAPRTLAGLTRDALLGKPLPERASTNTTPAPLPDTAPSLPADLVPGSNAVAASPAIPSRWAHAPVRVLEGLVVERPAGRPVLRAEVPMQTSSGTASPGPAASSVAGAAVVATPPTSARRDTTSAAIAQLPQHSDVRASSPSTPRPLASLPADIPSAMPMPSHAPLPPSAPALDRTAAEALQQRIEQVREELAAQRDEMTEALRRQPRGLDPNDDEAVRRLLERVEALRHADRFRSGQF
jgi:hypothetical protein